MREPLGNAESNLTIRGSRFIGLLRRVEQETEAKALLAATREEHPGANHVAYAYAIGPERSLLHGQSDDGEPHGTAGRPILDQIAGAELTYCLIMVVRYFGGVKLGTGGLVRAYGDCAREALEAVRTRELVERRTFRLAIPYPHADSVFRLLEELDGNIDSREFSSIVSVTGSLPLRAVEQFRDAVRDLTSGKCYPEISESRSE